MVKHGVLGGFQTAGRIGLVIDLAQAAGRAALKSVKVENRELVVTLGL